MEAQRRPLGISAPYGQACMACSRAKCKCVPVDGSTSCERCGRLNKTCEPIPRVRRRKDRKPNISKTARLEEKLDGIALLLKSATQSTSVSAQLDQALREQGVGARLQTTATVDQHLEQSGPNFNNASTDSESYFSTPSTSNTTVDFSPSDIEDHLAVFRSFKSKHFPFIHIPSEMTASEFRQERPFTWLCVLSSTLKQMSQQQAFGNMIRNEISQRMIFNAEKSLDLLFGLLVYLNWFNSQVCSKPQTALFTQLALSLVYDLCLNRPSTGQPHIMKTFGIQPNNCMPPYNDRIRTNDERRAVLACFLLSSTVSSYYQKIDTLRWTDHMEECLQILSDSPEAFTDELLVQQVKLQLVYERALHAPRFDSDVNNSESVRLAEFHYRALQVQLEEVKNNIPKSCHKEETILGSIYNVELAINELVITDKPLTSFYNLNSCRIDRLCGCLVSIKAWFDLYLNMPLVSYIDSSFCTYAQLTHCLICLYKLSTFEDPSWDQKMVRDTIDVLLVLDQMAAAMEQVPEVVGIVQDENVENLFSKGAKLFRAVRRNWEPKFNNISRNAAQDVAFTGSPLSFTDFMWLPDFLTS